MAATEQDAQTAATSRNTSALAKGMVLSFGGEFTRLVLTVVYGIVIARFLKAEAYGIFFLGVTTLNFASGLFTFRPVEDTLMRFIGPYVENEQIGRAKATIRLSLVTGLTISALFGLAYFCLADVIALKLFHKPDLAVVLRTFSVGVPLYAMVIICVSSTRAFKDLRSFVIVNKIALHVFTFLFATGVLLLGHRLRGLTMAYNVALFCCLLLAVRFLRTFLAQYRGTPCGTPEYRRYFAFLGSACLINVFLFFFQWSDQLLVAIFLPAKEMGVYTASKKMAVVLQLLYIALNAIFVPMISHQHGAGQQDQLGHSFKTAARWMLTLSMPIFLTLVIFSRDILALYGETFPSGAPAMTLIAIGCFAHVAIGSTEYILMMTGRQRWMAVNAVVAAAMAIILGIWIVPRYGMVGAAAVHGGMLILANTVALIEVYLLVRVHPFHGRYFKVFGIGALTALVVIPLRHLLSGGHPVLIPLLLISFLFILYLCLVLIFGISGEERGMLLNARREIAARLGSMLGSDNEKERSEEPDDSGEV